MYVMIPFFFSDSTSMAMKLFIKVVMHVAFVEIYLEACWQIVQLFHNGKLWNCVGFEQKLTHQPTNQNAKSANELTLSLQSRFARS